MLPDSLLIKLKEIYEEGGKNALKKEISSRKLQKN